MTEAKVKWVDEYNGWVTGYFSEDGAKYWFWPKEHGGPLKLGPFRTMEEIKIAAQLR